MVGDFKFQETQNMVCREVRSRGYFVRGKEKRAGGDDHQ